MAVTGEALARVPFFKELDDRSLQEIAPHVDERRFSRGQVIVLEGDGCRVVYFVARGVVRTRRLSLEGREQVLGYLGPGQVFGFVAALDRGAHLATVDALSGAEVYSVPCQRLRELMSEHHDLALAALKYLASEVRRLSDMVEGLALHTVRTRLARFLLAQADGALPPQRWTQEEIASQIGTVREMVGRTLRALAADGLIRRERGRVAIMNRDGLEGEASGA